MNNQRYLTTEDNPFDQESQLSLISHHLDDDLEDQNFGHMPPPIMEEKPTLLRLNDDQSVTHNEEQSSQMYRQTFVEDLNNINGGGDTLSLLSDATLIFNNNAAAQGGSAGNCNGDETGTSMFIERDIQNHNPFTNYIDESSGNAAMGGPGDFSTNRFMPHHQHYAGSPLMNDSTGREVQMLFTPSGTMLGTTPMGGVPTPSFQLPHMQRLDGGFDTAVQMDLASKAKHEQRRQNLRRKRSREQVMQVVDQFIREQTALTTMQAFIEANFLNDMMYYNNQVINGVIETELRKIIKQVLSEIYFAHQSTLFIENIIQNELRYIVKDVMHSQRQQLEIQAQQKKQALKNNENLNTVLQQLSEELLSNVVKSVISNISRELFEEQQADLLVNQVLNQIFSEQFTLNKVQTIDLPLIADKYLSSQLLEPISEALVDQTFNKLHLIPSLIDQLLIIDHLFEQTLTSLTLNLCSQTFQECHLSNQLFTSTISQLTLHETQDIIIEHLLQDYLIPRTIHALMSDVIQKQSIILHQKAQRVAERDKQVIVISIFEDILSREIKLNCQETLYEENLNSNLTELLYEGILLQEIQYIAQAYIAEQIELHSIYSEVGNSLTEHAMKELQQEQALDIILDNLVYAFPEQIVSNLINEYIVQDQYIEEISQQKYEAILKQAISHEVKKTYNIEKDSRHFANKILDKCIPRLIKEQATQEIIVQQIKEEIFEGSVRNQIELIAQEEICIRQDSADVLEEHLQKLITEIITEAKQSQESIPLKQPYSKTSSIVINLAEEHHFATFNNPPTQPHHALLFNSSSSASSSSLQENIKQEQQQLGSPKWTTHDQAAEVLDSFLIDFVNSYVKRFTIDILASIILPHKIYKRIMTRVIRKTTYSAIQAAVDVAYRLEEDTINIADKLLDLFVEQQIREMVMAYPNDNQQRRSHTILIDSNIVQPVQQQQIITKKQTPCFENEGNNNSNKRTRNNIIQGQQQMIAPPARTVNSSSNVQIHPPSKFMFISEEEMQLTSGGGPSKKNKSRIVGAPQQYSSNQTKGQNPNHRYNSCMLGSQAIELQNNEATGQTTDEMPLFNEQQLSSGIYEENKGKNLPFAAKAVNGIISAKDKLQARQRTYKSNNTSGHFNKNKQSHLHSAQANDSLSSHQVIFTQSQDTNSQGGLHTLPWALDKPLAQPHLAPQKTANQRASRKSRSAIRKDGNSSSPEAIIDDEDDEGVSLCGAGGGRDTYYFKMTPGINGGGLGGNESHYKTFAAGVTTTTTTGRGVIKANEPKEGIKFIENKNSGSNLNSFNRSQTAVGNASGKGNGGNKIQNFHYEAPRIMATSPAEPQEPINVAEEMFFQPTLNQFDALIGSQSSSILSASQKVIMPPASKGSAVHFETKKPPQLQKVDFIHSNVRWPPMGQAKSPQHQRYFATLEKEEDTRGNKVYSNHGIKKVERSSSKGALVSQAPQIYQTTQKKNEMNFEYQIQNHDYAKTDPKVVAGLQYTKQQANPSANGNSGKNKANSQETVINGQLQKLLANLKSRVYECKQRASVSNSGGGGPSTSLLMTQLASDVLHSLAEQILTVKQHSLHALVEQDLRELGLSHAQEAHTLSQNAQCREALFSIDKKIKELVTKLQQNQTLMNKNDYQLCMLQANQLAMLNYQKLTCLMNSSSTNQSMEGQQYANTQQRTADMQLSNNIKPLPMKQDKMKQLQRTIGQETNKQVTKTQQQQKQQNNLSNQYR